jgi:predicted amidohydrolase
MKDDIDIAIVQADIIWENPQENLKKYSHLLKDTEKVDVIFLPEMFSTGFSMRPQTLKETMTGPSVSWMKEMAKEMNAAVTGSLIIEEYKKIYNRAVWMYPNGEVQFYDKRHLYTMGQEHLHYSPGKEKTIIEYKEWKFCPQICYDLRFPAFARNLEDYDVVFYMANWPSPRHNVWKNLLIARAVENQSYCIGINRVGTDGTGLNYLGDSACVDAKGCAKFMGKQEIVSHFTLNYKDLQSFRKSFPLLSDRDNFKIID